jgi:hypothetical protein
VPSLLVPAIAAALAAFAVGLGYLLSEARARRRFAGLEQAWRRYAEARGLALVPFSRLSGKPADVGPPLVHGQRHGVDVELTVHSSTLPLTCVEALLPGVTEGFVLLVRRRARRFPRAFEGRRLAEAPTGNKAFDASFALLSNEPDLARSLVDRRLAQVVLAFPRVFVDLCVCENRLLLSWRGLETDGRVLDAAVEVVFTACRRRA